MTSVTIPETLGSDQLVLRRITSSNVAGVRAIMSEDDYMLRELDGHYLPRCDAEGRLNRLGYSIERDGVTVGLSLLGVSSWEHLRGYTGADILPRYRGQGLAPAAKPHLFYLGFAVLDLNRIETGCFVSNTASWRSIEKTRGFVYEGTLRQFARNAQGQFEDERRYAILRRDWEQLYNPDEISMDRE